MSSIYGIVNSALSGLNTYTSAIDVISTNIGNVETPGYTRQQAVIQSTAPINTANGVVGTGVGVTNIERIYNAFLVTQLRMANQDMGKWTAQQQGLNSIEQIFANSGDSSLSSTMTAFWNNWQNLVNNPSGSTERSLLVNSATNLVKAFHDMSTQLTDIQKGIDKSVVENVAAVNSLIQKIADLNQNIKQAGASGQNTNTYKDDLDLQVAKLAELININAYTNPNGEISIQLASGKPLVEGTSTWLLGTQTNAITGMKDITWPDGSSVVVVTDDITGGKLGGSLAVRDTMITEYQDELDTLARSVIDEVNWLHTGGYDIDGNIGKLFFTSEATPTVLPTASIKPTINLNSGAAIGDTFSATVNTYDSAGNATPMKITFTKVDATHWSWVPTAPGATTADNAVVTFNSDGQLVTGGSNPVITGTRFTKSKQARQKSPYQYLLRPKAGGIALALSVLGDKFNSLLNITIVYPDFTPTFWEFLCGKLKRVTVRIESIEIPQHILHGDYEGDEKFRADFQLWVQELWQEKDLQIKLLRKEAGRPSK